VERRYDENHASVFVDRNMQKLRGFEDASSRDRAAFSWVAGLLGRLFRMRLLQLRLVQLRDFNGGVPQVRDNCLFGL
jgi:hypothetical protein